MLLFIAAEFRLILVDVQLALYPLQFLWLADVHIFDPYGLAVNFLKVGDDILKSGWTEPQDLSGVEDGLQIRLFQSEVLHVQVRLIFSPFANGIGLGEEVPPGAVAVNEFDYLEFLDHILWDRYRFATLRVFYDVFPILGTLHSEIEALKEGPPAGFDAVGIMKILVVKFSKISC